MKTRKTLTYEQALHRAANLCTRSEQCEHDIITKSLAWGLSAEEAQKLTDYLKKEKFIDNARYAAAFVKDKSRYSKWGRIKIAYALRNKGICAEIIAESLKTLDENNSFDTLVQLLQAKRKTIRYKDDYDLRVKLIRFALGRGFEMREIEKALKI